MKALAFAMIVAVLLAFGGVPLTDLEATDNCWRCNNGPEAYHMEVWKTSWYCSYDYAWIETTYDIKDVGNFYPCFASATFVRFKYCDDHDS